MAMTNIVGSDSGWKEFSNVAFIERFPDNDVAVVKIYPRTEGYGIDFSTEIANYETLNRGAAASARKELRKLEKAAKEKESA